VSWKLVTCLLSMGKMDWARVMSQDSRAWRQLGFVGEYPLARIEFKDPELPIRLTLEAFSPFIPHEEDDSGLPAAVLRYRVRNDGRRSSTVSIAWSIDNPVVPEQGIAASKKNAATSSVPVAPGGIIHEQPPRLGPTTPCGATSSSG